MAVGSRRSSCTGSRTLQGAEEIAGALRVAGQDVFFDREALAGGEDFNAVIRLELERADQFVLLMSLASVESGAFYADRKRLAQER